MAQGNVPSPPAGSTIALLDRVRSGDAAALDALFARCLPPLRRWARGRLPRNARGMHDTTDLVQDVALKVLRHIDQFRPEHEGALQAYLRRAVLNRIRDEVRGAGRRPRPQELVPDLAEAPAASPLEEAIGLEAVERYERALARLPPHEREAIIARIELGYSYAQIAEALGRPSSDAARVAVHRALVRLAREMGHEG